MQEVPGEQPLVIPGTVGNAVNDSLPKCIASDCMAWRTAHVGAGRHVGFCGAEPVPPLAVSEIIVSSDLS